MVLNNHLLIRFPGTKLPVPGITRDRADKFQKNSALFDEPCNFVVMKCVCCIFFVLLTSFVSAGQYNVFEENGKVGVKNEQGKVLIPAQYESIGWSNRQFTVVDKVTGYRQGGQWGLITLDNHRVTKPLYYELIPAEGSVIIARKKSGLSMRVMTGCLNSTGKEIIPFQYDGLTVAALRAVVYSRSENQFKYGLIDMSNKVLIPVNYAGIHPLGSLRFSVENNEKKMAIFSDLGKQLTKFNIDSLSDFRKNYAIIYQNQKQGVIDRDGIIKAEANYREIKIQEDGAITARQADEWIFLDGQNKSLRKITADSILALGKNLFKVSYGGQARFTDSQMNPVGNGPFTSIGTFIHGKALVSTGKKFGLVKSNGLLLINPQYAKLRWNERFIFACIRPEGKDKWILLDSAGNHKTTARPYDHIADFNGLFFPIRNRGYWGALDPDGKEIIACVYDSLVQHQGNHIAVKFRGQYGIIDLKESWVVTPKPNRSQLVDDEHYIERTQKTWFLKTYDGTTIYFSDNEFEVRGDHIVEHLSSGNRWNINLQGRIIERLDRPEDPVQRIDEEQEGLRAIQRDGKFGFVDNRGRLRIANRYDDVQSFTQGLAAIKIRGKWGFISHQEKIIIQPAYEYVTPFREGYSVVQTKGLKGLIDISGRIILPMRFELIEILTNKRLRITQNGLTGLADSTGKILIMPKYTYVDDVGNGYVIIGRDGRFGLLNLQGLSTIPLIYESLIYDRYHDQFLALKKSPWLPLKL